MDPFPMSVKTRVVLGIVLLLVAPTAASAADEWVPVAVGGLGNPSQRFVDALAVFGDYVYFATHQVGADASVFRAPIASDTTWEDVTPLWGPPAGDVSALQVAGDSLFLGTSMGQLWRRLARSAWIDLTTPWASGDPILALGRWDRVAAETRLCALLRQAGRASVWCLSGTGWTGLPSPPLAVPNGVASGRLASFDGELYLGVGGGSADSRGCEVWRYNGRDGWRALTTDCFGGWDSAAGEGLTWLTDMAVFGRRLYLATAGHTRPRVLVRFDGRGVELVTPLELYDCDDAFGRCPLRYNALAVSGGRIYVGTRTLEGVALPSADVLTSDDGAAWRFSNVPGFGVESNDTVSAMGSRDAYLYVGVINIADGFQVWRRTPRLLELIPPIYRDLWELRRAHAPVLRCLLPPLPCPPPWDRLYQPIAGIRVALEAARHAQDNPVPIKAARAAMTEVYLGVNEAEQLAATADKLKDTEQARQLRHQAAAKLGDAITLAQASLKALQKAVGDGIGLPQEPVD